MGVFNNLRKYQRFCTQMGQFLANTLSLEEAKEIVRERLKKREELFLNLVDKAIYANPRSPYLKLLDSAGYKFQDIKNLIENFGIEQTLSRLVEDGVYITFDEFKGRKKVIRNGASFDFKESDFDNPYLSSCFGVESGATSSPGTRTMIDFDFLQQEAVDRALVLDFYGLLDAPSVLWFPILPGNAGVQNIFRQAKIGRTPLKWFSQIDKRSIRPSIKNRLGTNFIVQMASLLGKKVPKPEYVDLSQADRIAEHIASIIKEHSKCSIWTYANSAIRICAAAKEKNLHLEGAHFFVSGEPVTYTKLNEIKSSGANAIPYYAFVEGGICAYGCVHSSSSDDMHLLRDRMAIITYKRKMEAADDAVDAFLFTSILAESPKILLNVETGDYGVIASRKCGCGFQDFGLSEHISGIKSFEKFTSEGMTFMIAELIHIAEDILPAQYGGSSADYQVWEESESNGMSFINIAVSPRVGDVNESDMVETIIQELAKGPDSKRLMAGVWAKAGTVRVKRIEPIPTKRGKLFAFRA